MSFDDICQNLQFLTFIIFVAEISSKHFRKLDKILRNFPSWQMFIRDSLRDIRF